jgi:NAD(P)-dependent dehydrogenase (short-subunit alcohol dehydrogenase family)
VSAVWNDLLAGRVALVFGAGAPDASWSNGRAAAVAYARHGAHVVAVDIDRNRAEMTARIIRSESDASEKSIRTLALSADVADSKTVEAAVEHALADFGTIDILHNNVGLTVLGNPPELSEDDWDRVLAANLKGAFLTMKYVLPAMEKAGRGVITNISSINSIGIGPYQSVAYYASKAGLDHLTRAVASAYADRNIRTNAILPGIMRTPGSIKSLLAEYASERELIEVRDRLSPTGRMGDPWDVANASVFLASDLAKYINGVVLPIDGGLHCRMGWIPPAPEQRDMHP